MKKNEQSPDMKKKKLYRIGEYAQKMGVTPDLLKHYEKLDLIRSYTTESGYRYYPFTESIPLLECLSLRNYDMPLQEMHDLLYSGTIEQYHQAMKERAQAIERHIVLEQAMLEEFEALDSWLRCMKDQSLYMLMEEQEPVYFLPHSKQHDFLEDARIQEILPRWIEWMPVVKPCRLIPWREDMDPLLDAFWGLCVPVSRAEAYGLPVNGAVEQLPGGRQLICHYRYIWQSGQSPNAIWEQIRKKLSDMAWSPEGPVRQIVLTSLFHPERHVSCGTFMIPVPGTVL